MERKRVVIAGLVVVALLVYSVSSQAFELLFDKLNYPIHRNFGLTIPEYLGTVVGLAWLAFGLLNKAFNDYLGESANELMKVVYPTPKESGQSAVVVVVLVAIATGLLTFCDSIWTVVTKWILST